MLGDVLVFSRDGGGHVGIYVGEDAKTYRVLGGNQGDKVSIVPILKTRCVGIRRTNWKISQPKNVRKIFLSESGTLSTNEQ
jgi:cell wall-associated NlpC family hydrolase